jgi:hypothetical protein
VAVATQPAAVAGLESRERANVNAHDLLRRCEVLLRALLRQRRRVLGLKHRELAFVTKQFDHHRFSASGRMTALAYVLAGMHWCGCSHPAFLMQAPLHPPTGLLRWLTAFTVMEQVDQGQQLFELLALEERRVFEHARALIERLERMRARCSPRGIVLLPELLQVSNKAKPTVSGMSTTRRPRKINHLAAPARP